MPEVWGRPSRSRAILKTQRTRTRATRFAARVQADGLRSGRYETIRDLPNLDFVRSVAVISVVVEHTLMSLGMLKVGPFPIPFLGIMGVMVFFVLTTLVLMWSLERKPHTLDFYIRRVFRIYPLALATIAVVLLFHAPVAGSEHEFFRYAHPSLRTIWGQLTLVPNLISGDLPIMGVMWSLPYELEMYVLLPALFFYLRKNFAVWPLLLIWVMTVLLTRHAPPNSHTFGMAIGYFLPGAMAYVGFGRWTPRLPAWLLAVFLATLWVGFLFTQVSARVGWLVCCLGWDYLCFAKCDLNGWSCQARSLRSIRMGSI